MWEPAIWTDMGNLPIDRSTDTRSRGVSGHRPGNRPNGREHSGDALGPDGNADAKAVPKPISGGEEDSGRDTDAVPKGLFVDLEGVHLSRQFHPEGEAP